MESIPSCRTVDVECRSSCVLMVVKVKFLWLNVVFLAFSVVQIYHSV